MRTRSSAVNDSNSFVERFGRKEKSGVGGRSKGPGDIDARARLLTELSELRGHHESLQRERDDARSEHQLQFDPNLFGDNSLPRDREDGILQLEQGDKDAIEALFASDDFAEMFNAGAGQVSRVPTVGGGRKVSLQRSGAHEVVSYAPVCHLCARKLAPSDVAAFVSKSFDPSRPTARRKGK